jgi:hypothetical protein
MIRVKHITRNHVVTNRRFSNLRPKTYMSRSVKCNTGIYENINIVSFYVGKSIMLFTMFYCGLNYFYYKEQHEKNKNKDNDK